MLLLPPFAPKLVKYSRHCESLNYVWKSTNCSYRRKMSSKLSKQNVFEKTFKKFVVHIFTLLLTPFGCANHFCTGAAFLAHVARTSGLKLMLVVITETGLNVLFCRFLNEISVYLVFCCFRLAAFVSNVSSFCFLKGRIWRFSSTFGQKCEKQHRIPRNGQFSFTRRGSTLQICCSPWGRNSTQKFRQMDWAVSVQTFTRLQESFISFLLI